MFVRLYSKIYGGLGESFRSELFEYISDFFSINLHHFVSNFTFIVVNIDLYLKVLRNYSKILKAR